MYFTFVLRKAKVRVQSIHGLRPGVIVGKENGK